MAAPAVDASYLAASYSVPETTFQSLLSDPTVELVQSLLVQIEAKAREYDDLRSDKIKVDVELEAAVQSGDARARTLKASADKAQKEVEQLQQKLAREELARQQIEKELNDLKNSSTSSASEVQALQSRIKTLESQNRDTLAMHEAKGVAHDRLAKELSDQHQKFVDLRKQVSALEESKQSLENAAANVKFRETNFQQEIELLRKNNEWFEGELKTRSEDQTKYRKEKNAQVAELQRANAEASETIDTLRRTETSLRQHIEKIEQKADESRARIEQLEDEATQNQSSFRNELDSARRLATLHQESAELVKGRLQQLQAELAQLSDNAALEIGQLQAEVESERNKVAEAEGRIAELETGQENLLAQISELENAARMPATPRRPMNSAFETPGRAGSPAVFSPGGSRLKGGMSVTHLYSENMQLKSEIRTLREKSEEKDATLAEMLESLEQAQPEIEELRRENEMLTNQTTEISALLDEATADREAARKDVRKAVGDLEGTYRECTTLRQQLQDTVTQMQLLLWRQEASERGMESLTPEQQERVLHAAQHNNEMPDNQIEENTATGHLIAKHLLLFTDIQSCSQKNQELLAAIRSVAESHEGQEARDKAEQHKKDEEELGQLRGKLADQEEQIRSLDLRLKSVTKEREMYRRITTSRGHQLNADGTPDFGQSFDSRAAFATPPPGGSFNMDQTPHSKEVAGYEKLIKDLQSHLDLLREENATDRATLKQQVDSLTKESNQLQSDKLRLDNQVRREQDRYTHLEGNMKLLQSEKTTLQERYASIQDALAKQDEKVDKAQQEALDAAARAEGLDREIVNLKASQTMWKTIEARLTERNKELTDERDRLSKMVTDVQSLRNEQELSNAENRRRLQDRVDALEAELSITQRKLEDEIAEHKKTTQQRDYERTDAQRRIDDFIKAKNEADVKFASANTARQQLEQRVTELQSQLQSAEERAQALRPRQTNRADEDNEDATNREEELEAQVTELQRKIERKQEDLEVANGQIETFQAIAQEAEDQLRSQLETHEQYEQEMNAAQQEKDATIADLQQRVDEISSELATSNTELTELRGQHEQETLRLTQQKDALETEIARLKGDVTDYKAEVDNQAQLVASQAEIATRAQQDYEHELAKHGETMKSLRVLRDEHNQLKMEIAQFKAQAEAAQATLAQNEEHWTTTREQFESQIAEAQRNYDGAKQHNKTLLRQFDDYKTQIEALKSNRAAASDDAANTTSNSSGLQEINDYLRREKEILEVQLNLKDQEVKRQEQQLNHFQTQLDQAREKLIAEQGKAQQGGSNLQSLQTQVEQLNVYRESTTTLRNENRRIEAQLAEKNTEMESLHEQLEPLQARVAELEGEIELHLGHLKAVEEDRDRWQKRHQDVLQRYDRIDPKELEDLKQQIETLQTERDQATGQVTELKEQVTGLNEKMQSTEGTQATAMEEAVNIAVRAAKQDAKERFNKLHGEKMGVVRAEVAALTTERNELQEKLASVQQELDIARQQATLTQSESTQSQEQLTSLQQQLEELKSQLASAQQELETTKTARDEAVARADASSSANVDVNKGEEGQIDETNSEPLQQEAERLKIRVTEAENKEKAASNAAAGLQVQLGFAREKITELEQKEAEDKTRIVKLEADLKAAQSSAPAETETETQTAVEPSTAAPYSDEIDKLKEELAAAQKEVEDLRTRAEAAEAAASNAKSVAPTEAQPNNEQLEATKAQLEEREARVAELELTLQQRQTMLDQRETKIAGRESKAQDLREQANNKIRSIRKETDEEKAKLAVQHQAEIDQLKKQIVASATTTPGTPKAPTSETPIKSESIPWPDANKDQIRVWMNSNKEAKEVAQMIVSKYTAPLKSEIGELNKEIETLKSAEKPSAAANQVDNHNHAADLAIAKAEHEVNLKTALEQKEAMMNRQSELKVKLTKGQLSALKVKWAVFEKAAKETPTEEVAKVYEEAKNAKDTTTQTSTPARPQSAASVQQPGLPQPGGIPRPLSALGQQVPVSAQTNGAPNPFQQSGQNAGSNAALNPFTQSARGIVAPGLANQVQTAPGQQVQTQNAGRGHGTGPAALKSLVGAGQTGIPRGGSGIPQPGSGIPQLGGRGAGRGQQQQTVAQIQSGIARGGAAARGGRGGGRGQGQSQNNSPRTSLNPGASQFQPGQGAGRGQKRNADGEAEGSGARGNKRPRGGRGGQGGGEGAGGAPAAAE
ncbi:Protein mlp1 [Ascochyta rabiei]|uniref:Protein mlp1 n=1 Tax=Didymella rabiei TaxID=5454 RepID=UPI0019007DF7|nr:Protein mlp1 [Ascochyta rabiei]UPX15517.1 Protein mlp1 [Ascochyta rabiei]